MFSARSQGPPAGGGVMEGEKKPLQTVKTPFKQVPKSTGHQVSDLQCVYRDPPENVKGNNMQGVKPRETRGSD